MHTFYSINSWELLGYTNNGYTIQMKMKMTMTTECVVASEAEEIKMIELSEVTIK